MNKWSKVRFAIYHLPLSHPKETTTPDRSVQMEAQFIHLNNEIEQLKMINTELQTKYRDCSFKLSKSIGRIAEMRS